MTPQATDDGGEKFLRFLGERTAELQATGYSQDEARNQAMFEWRIAENWPKEWSDFMQVIIFGDFVAPKETLFFPTLGITIEPENLAGKTVVRTALTALRARVNVKDKTLASFLDAATRVDALLSIWAALGWGNWASGWWCHLAHGNIMGGITAELPTDRSEAIFKALKGHRPEIELKVASALYWIREPRRFLQETHDSDELRVYAGYWNAFECLVEAVCLTKPVPKLSPVEKQRAIDKLIAGKQVDAATIVKCYHEVVNPGFIGKARHALSVCFGDRADRYFDQCFRVKPEQDRLYQIRNSIDHGSIDADNPRELARISGRQRLLWEIVFIMLGWFLPTDRPRPSL
jgi:hypothetical protein